MDGPGPGSICALKVLNNILSLKLSQVSREMMHGLCVMQSCLFSGVSIMILCKENCITQNAINREMIISKFYFDDRTGLISEIL